MESDSSQQDHSRDAQATSLTGEQRSTKENPEELQASIFTLRIGEQESPLKVSSRVSPRKMQATTEQYSAEENGSPIKKMRSTTEQPSPSAASNVSPRVSPRKMRATTTTTTKAEENGSPIKKMRAKSEKSSPSTVSNGSPIKKMRAKSEKPSPSAKSNVSPRVSPRKMGAPTEKPSPSAVSDARTQNPSELLPAPSREEFSGPRYSRHCGFCLRFHSCELCVCQRRAYCSRACLETDKKGGQGHLNWCQKFEYGEEDIDFEYGIVRGRGFGLFAKRPIPKLYRIVVEPVYTHYLENPVGVNSLTDVGIGLELKFRRYAFSGDPNFKGGKDYVAIHMARVKHSCIPNCGRYFCEVANVAILYALRDIEKGEELSMKYRPKNVPLSSPDIDFIVLKEYIKSLRGIVCDPSCPCNSLSFQMHGKRAKELVAEIEECEVNLQPAKALELTSMLLKIQNYIHSSLISISKTHYNAFRIAVMSEETRSEAEKHIQKVCEIFTAICPLSKTTEKYVREYKNPKIVPTYGKMDKTNTDKCHYRCRYF